MRQPADSAQCLIERFLPYIHWMELRSSRGRPRNSPADFIHPCQPIVAKESPVAPLREPRSAQISPDHSLSELVYDHSFAGKSFRKE